MLVVVSNNNIVIFVQKCYHIIHILTLHFTSFVIFREVAYADSPYSLVKPTCLVPST